MRSGLPVLITAGAPPVGLPGTRRGARDAGHFWVQDLYDQNAIVRQYMKWEHRLELQDNPGLVVSRALQVACTPPRGPVYLSLPREVALAALPDASFPSAAQLGIALPPAPDPSAMAGLASRLVAAKNPAIVVSGSGRDPASVALLVELCERLAMPVVDSASRSYHCFPMDHPLYQGDRALNEMDVVVALDAEVPWMPGPRAPSPDAYVAVIDVDPVKLKIPTYEFEASVRITATRRLRLQAFCFLEVNGSARHQGTPACRALGGGRDERKQKAAQPTRRPPRQDSHRPDVARRSCIGELLDDNCVLVDDTLTHNPVYGYLIALDGRAAISATRGSAGGWGSGRRARRQAGRPRPRRGGRHRRRLLHVRLAPPPRCGRRAQYGAPFLSVIYQNRSYSTGTRARRGASTRTATPYKAGLEGGYFDPPIDFAKEAEAAGAYGRECARSGGLRAALRRGLEKVARHAGGRSRRLARMLQKD